jgi:hypothetical protein|tara:strand:+ start:338 stop:631 length:294 start_codon:yes stop_codon:yes gene_type:complete
VIADEGEGLLPFNPGLVATVLLGTKPGYGKPGRKELAPLAVLDLKTARLLENGKRLFSVLFTKNGGITGFDFGFGGIILGVLDLLTLEMDLGKTGVF